MSHAPNQSAAPPDGFYSTKDKGIFVDPSMVAICPFEPSHMMKKERLQYHIIDCIKHYKGTKVPCPYNHTEYFEPYDLLNHLKVCSRRADSKVQQHSSLKNRMEVVNSKPDFLSTPKVNDDRRSDECWGLD